MSEEIKDSVFYAGKFSKQLDEKRRITIPAKWRFKGDDEENSYLAMPTTYGSIAVLPPSMTADLYQKISKISMTNPAKRRAVQRWMEQSSTFGCDKQGRVMLDEDLLKLAGIKKEVCIVGMGPTFEIWNPEKRREWLGEPSESTRAEDISMLEELGL